jgi:hypothetical protein
MNIDWSTATVRFEGGSGQLIVFLSETPDRAWIHAYNAIASRDAGGKLWRKRQWGLASHAYGPGKRSVIGMFGARRCSEAAMCARLQSIVDEANRSAELARLRELDEATRTESRTRVESDELARRFLGGRPTRKPI